MDLANSPGDPAHARNGGTRGSEETPVEAVKFTIVGNPNELKVSQCTFCAHRSPDGTACKAFPNGIPVELLYNEHDHRLEFAGDNGVRYQPIILGRAGLTPANIQSNAEFELDKAAIV
jgi:hypothetical protein